jgi:hypothetical protein
MGRLASVQGGKNHAFANSKTIELPGFRHCAMLLPFVNRNG